MASNFVKLIPSCATALSALFIGCSDGTPTQAQRDARWHNNQGVVQMDQHQYARAVEKFSTAVTLDAEYSIGLANLGIAYFSLGKYDSAAVSIERALQSDPTNRHAHYTLGLIYSAQGTKYESALSAFERVAAADDEDPLVLYYRGQVKAKLGRSESAIEDFKASIRLDSSNVSAYYALANQYRRTDQKEKWLETLNQFNQLSQSGHTGVSSAYQGQGKYAEVVADASFSRPDEDDRGRVFSFTAKQVSVSGRFASIGDIDHDGDPDLVVGDTRTLLLENNAGEFFVGVALGDSAWTASGASMGDLDNDGRQDLVLTGSGYQMMRQDPQSVWELYQEIPGDSDGGVLADPDHDGDLDLVALRSSGLRCFYNDGTGWLDSATDSSGLFANDPVHKAVCSDLDNDRDLDCLVLSSGVLVRYSNNRDGTFSKSTVEVQPSHSTVLDFVVEDFTQDGSMDLAVLLPRGEIGLYVSAAGKTFELKGSARTRDDAPRTVLPADLDNDGDLDLVTGGPGGIEVVSYFRNRLDLHDDTIIDAPAERVLAADFDVDGSVDLWVDGVLLQNEVDAQNWLSISLEGLNSNRDGIGAKIEVKTTNRLQKREVRGNSDSYVVANFGLADADSVEFVRVLWPSGVRQTEPAMPVNRVLNLTELNRKGTSCPIVYAWDGQRFRFVSDIMGGAIIGYLLGPGEYNQPDTDEYLPLGEIDTRDGSYVIQLANQLEEIIYTDAIHLIAVDHRSGTTVLPNERLLSRPPYPEFDIFALEGLRPPEGAEDHMGNDVRSEILAADNDWIENFESTGIHGYASDHHVTLDLGDLSSIAHPVLVAHGWVDYAHSTSNWAAAQRGLTLNPPTLEVIDETGNWRQVKADLGLPAGLPKQMVVDLKGLFSSDDYRIRIATNAAVYWDQFLIGSAVDEVTAIHRLVPTFSDLHWRGYPEHTSINGTFAFEYEYETLKQTAPWGSHSGSYTRFGDVTPLTQEVDDRFAIMFHGDELTVEFRDTLPQLAAGSTRTFLLYADGFGKDMDYHSAYSLSVEPLPFHAMSGYPYAPDEAYPRGPAHQAYRQEYNSRRIRGYYE
jgi:Tfp pilus assembly protein PilF